MLQNVEVGVHSPDALAEVAGQAAIDELRELANRLNGARILHVNATPYGGGVSYQMPDGVGGFLVDLVDATAEKVLYLMRHPREAAELANLGQRGVAEHFLISRLVRDELRLAAALLAA
ncbi:MAG: hypothetical protein M1401_11570 [Chloroflexi bacterium]|nr:hypothetical protein [Chloroflexota bacterium]MCL5109483.1 hypothetical protein [Chloroflexota bacterium]